MHPYMNGGSLVQQEYEWKLQEVSHLARSQIEAESEAVNEFNFRDRLSGIQQAARVAVPVAKKLAPIVAVD